MCVDPVQSPAFAPGGLCKVGTKRLHKLWLDMEILWLRLRLRLRLGLRVRLRCKTWNSVKRKSNHPNLSLNIWSIDSLFEIFRLCLGRILLQVREKDFSPLSTHFQVQEGALLRWTSAEVHSSEKPRERGHWETIHGYKHTLQLFTARTYKKLPRNRKLCKMPWHTFYILREFQHQIPPAANGIWAWGDLDVEYIIQAPSFWPAGGPGRRWNAWSVRSCHSSSAYRCGPEREKRYEGMRLRIWKGKNTVYALLSAWTCVQCLLARLRDGREFSQVWLST